VIRAVAALLLGRYSWINQRDAAVLPRMGAGSAVCQQLQRPWKRQLHNAALFDWHRTPMSAA
jgi:hypothetical protein